MVEVVSCFARFNGMRRDDQSIADWHRGAVLWWWVGHSVSLSSERHDFNGQERVKEAVLRGGMKVKWIASNQWHPKASPGNKIPRAAVTRQLSSAQLSTKLGINTSKSRDWVALREMFIKRIARHVSADVMNPVSFISPFISFSINLVSSCVLVERKHR